MRLSIKLFLFSMILFCGNTLLLYAEQDSAGIGDTGAEAVVGVLRDVMYNQKQSDGEIFLVYQKTAAALRKLHLPEAKALFWNAVTEYYMGRAYQSFDKISTVIAHNTDLRAGKLLSLKKYYTNKKDTLLHYEKCTELLEKYLRKYGEQEHVCRLYSEVLGQMILLEDVGFLLAKGPKSLRYLDKAVEMNPDNVKARILIAGKKIYTPRLYGGDPGKGIQMMENILKLPDCDKEDLFNIFSGIGYAYSLMDDNSDALIWLGKAHRIYPGNVFVNGITNIVQ